MASHSSVKELSVVNKKCIFRCAMQLTLTLDIPDSLANRIYKALEAQHTDPPAYVGERVAAAMFEEWRKICEDTIGPMWFGVMEPEPPKCAADCKRFFGGFLACTDNPEICQRCGSHRGNH